MNREEIIRMAREAGALQVGFNKTIMQSEYSMFAHELERFAALVVAAERERIYFETSSDFVKSAVAAEREACAEICDRFQARDVGMQPAECAGAIRARGQK